MHSKPRTASQWVLGRRDRPGRAGFTSSHIIRSFELRDDILDQIGERFEEAPPTMHQSPSRKSPLLGIANLPFGR
jgi:hypothetical protein